MKMKFHASVALASLMLSLASGSANAADAPRPGSAPMSGHSEGSMKLHQAMSGGMSNMSMSGDADKDFAQMMIQHHQSAIAMSKVQLQYGKNAELKARAQKIIDDSQKDIAALESAAGKSK